MPKLKKDWFRKSMDMLSGLIEMHQKTEDVSNEAAAHWIRKNMNKRTFRNKVLSPETFTVGELAITVRRLNFTEEELTQCIKMMLKKEN